MSLIELYTSGSKDIAVFNLLFIFYAVATAALIFGLLKFTKQNVPVSRFVSGMLTFYFGALVIFDISFTLLRNFGQQIPGPGAALLLMLMGLAIGGTLMFVATQRIIFKIKDINKPTIGFIAAQPILAIVFFVILMVSGI